MNKIEKIIEIAKNVNESCKVIIFASSFKVVGKILKKSDMISKGILTLTNATVCNSLENFECSFSHHTYDWLNLFEDEIIAFSVLDDAVSYHDEEN